MTKGIPTAAITLAANQRKKEKTYWWHQLAGHPVKDSFPADHETANPVPSYRLETVDFSLPEEVSRPLIELSKGSSERMFIILMTGIFILLRKYTGSKDIIVGIPVSQPAANLDFINYALPVRLLVEDNNTFRQLLSKMRETLIEATANQNFPCEVLPGLLGLPWLAGEGFPLFDVSVSLKNIHQHTLQELAPNIMISFEYAANKMTGLFAYNAVCYRPDTIERLSGHYLELLAGALANPDRKISTLELLTEPEKEQILVTFNDTAGDFPGGVTVDELIDRQAEQTPGAIAVVYKEQRLSYAELKVQTGCLAFELKQKGLGPDQIAAVISDHTPEMVVILVGILKSGAAYLPIDPTYPQERIAYILNDSGAKILINKSEIRNDQKINVLNFENLNFEFVSNFDIRASNFNSPNLAYIIYTSGSTGRPKGVMIAHRSFIDFTTWAVSEFEHRQGYQVLLSNSYASDGSIQQIFPPLISGGTLHLIDKELRLDVVHYLVYLKTHKINNIDEVPILMKELVAQFAPNDREEKLPDLTCLSLGSEHVPIELVKKCRQHLNHRGRIINAYGPAEASVETTTYHCDGTSESEQSLIGKPRRNIRVYILDETGHLCPIGVRGEICISGVGLARGYLNRPELTAERFNRSYKTNILYKTGDRGCWLADGNIRFFGRMDDQIKIRGYRVELQEIENVLKSYILIKDAVVLTRENTTGESEICAYYVFKTGTLNKPALREYIEKRLPSYMIPTHLQELEKIPLTPNGKVDKNALPEPVADSTGGYLPPRNEIEKKLVEIWQNVLGVKKIGINDNFFAAGGDSIKTIQIASRLHTAGYQLQVKEIFNHPTISQLAPLVKIQQRVSEQAEVTGAIPLTPVQRWFFEEPFPAPHHFNQAVMFYAPEGFDKKILENVFTRIQEHHDILRATFCRNHDNKEIIQIVQGINFPLSLQKYDLKNQENSLTELNHKINEIQAGIDLENGPLMKLGLFHLDDGDRLLIVFHHLVVDGVSWRILFEDIETLYSQYKQGEEPVLPPKTDSFKQWSEKLSLYADSKTFLKEKAYWAQMEEKSVPEIKKDFEVEENNEKDIRNLSFTLSEEETNLLLTKVNRAYKTGINDILLTALGLGIKKSMGHDPVLIALEGHGREEILEAIDINRTVGWFTSVYPVVMNMNHADELGRQIKEVKETLRRIPHKGMGYGILKYLTAAEHKKEIEFKLKPQVSFNYLGQFDTDVKQISLFQIAKESPGHSQSLNNRREYLFNVGGMTANNRLTMTISYNETHFKPETAISLNTHFEAELKGLIAFCSAREKTELTPGDFTYKGLSIETSDRLVKEYPGLEDIYTLTPMQEGMLFHALIDEKSSSYFEQTSYRLEGELDIALVEKSLNELFKRHDILRTAFVHKDSERRVQVVLCDRTVDFYYEDISKIEAREEKEKIVREFKAKDKARSFDLSKETLMRIAILKLGNSEYEFTWSFHHILMDGWCVGIINSEFFEIYNSYLENRPYRLPQLKPYRTYIEWLEKQDKEKSAEYWQKYLESYEEQVGVPRTIARKKQENGPAYKNEQVEIILDREKTALLEALAAANHVTLNIATQVIWGILLGKYNGKEDMVFGAVVSGRPFQLEGVESILGLFINTIPVRIQFEGKMIFQALLQKAQEDAIASEPHHYSPLAEIQAGSVLKQNLIDHLFIFENYPIADQIEGYGDNGNKKNGLKLKLTHIDVFEQTNYDFNVILAGAKQLRIVLRYNSHVYDNNDVKKIAGHLNLIIDQVIANPSGPVSDIEIISEATKQELLNYFNENLPEIFAIMPIQSQLANAFRKYSTNTAIEYGTIHLTYTQLEHRASGISQWLRNHNTPVGSFIGIYLDNKIDIVSAMIGILHRGCIFVPLDTALPEKRVERMIRLTNMRVILTDTAHETKLTGMKEDIDIFIIDESFACSHEPGRNKIEEIKYDPEDKIYVYFTSGSTGQPNAIVGKNKSLVQFLQWESETFAITENDRISQLTAVGFDAFLRDIFVPLLAGGTACIPDSKEILLEANTFSHWLDTHRINLVHCVPSLFRIIYAKQLSPSSFSQLKYVLLSGEPINPIELQDWYRVFGPRIQLVNYYGPTETTMIKTFHLIDVGDIETGRIPAGCPIRGTRIIILDKHMNICDRGIRGEIYIRTAYGTHGYLHNPELNALRFIKNPFSTETGDFIYKTGDFGRQLENGEIEVLGRIDRQVKIRGVRIELENIENCLLKHDKIGRAIVISRKSATGESFLCAYIIYKKEETQTAPAASELREHLAKELPDYMIPPYFVPIEKVPLTPNGKIDIKALPGHEIKSDGGYIAPRNAMEEKLVELWAEILSIKKESISIDANFFDLGGHSLTTTTLLSRIHRDLDVRIPLAEMFKTPNIIGLSAYIKNLETEPAPEDKYAAIEPVEEKDYYPLSSAQKRLYFLQELDLQGIGYNMPLVLPLGKEIEKDRLELVLKQLIDRHESLRTSFHWVNEEAVQRVHKKVEFEIDGLGGREWSPDIMLNFIRPFDLSQAPLIRSGLIRHPDGNYTWLVDIHHIVSDGTSHMILTQDFMRLYKENAQLAPLPIQYKDFAQWQNHLFASGEIAPQEKYWLELYTGEIPNLDLPGDYKRPAVFTFAGAAHGFTLIGEEVRLFKALCRQSGGTLYMNMLAALNTLFYKYTGQEDIIIGSGIAGRRHANLQEIVGIFINTLAIRNYPQAEIPYDIFLNEVIANSVKAFENQDVQFEDLVEKLTVPRDLSRNPVFDIMVMVDNFRGNDKKVLSLENINENLPAVEYSTPTSKFDMTFFIVDASEDIYIDIQYYRAVFKHETIQRTASHLKKIIAAVGQTPNISLKDIEIISDEEKQQLLVEFNDTAAAYPDDKTIHQLFTEQVEKAPDAIALVQPVQPVGLVRPVSLSYKALNEQSGRMAGLLIEKGVLADNIVGIMMERSLEMIIGIMGILKSGGAYLPIDPEYPQERIAYMLNDSAAKILVTENEIVSLSKKCFFNYHHSSYSSYSSFLVHHPNQLAYLIYTSGSTGRPKGVAIEHCNVINFIQGITAVIDFLPGQTILALTTICFDIFLLETLLPLVKGLSVIIASRDQQRDPDKLAGTIVKNKINMLQITPSRLKLLMDCDNNLMCLKKTGTLMIGGENLPGHLFDTLKARYQEKIYHLYGPTETTVWSTVKDLTNMENITIGVPLANTRIYILDCYSNMRPIGAAGELFIAGDGLSRGYLNNSELTAEKFGPQITLITQINRIQKTKINKSFGKSRNPFTKGFLAAGGIFYKTGDLARWLADGNIEFLGRIDHQVKIRGFRIELGEIENQLLTHQEVKATIVTARKDNSGDKYLCAYIVVKKEETTSIELLDLKEYLAQRLPDYMIPAYFVQLNRIPLTANGKVNTKALPEPVLAANSTDYTPPGNDMETKLTEIWSEVLGIETEKIGVHDNFFALGGQSLKIVALTAKIYKEFNVKVPLPEAFKNKTIKTLAATIMQSGKNKYLAIEPIEKKDYYDVSFGQKRLWLLSQSREASLTFNMHSSYLLKEEVNLGALNKAFDGLSERHENLRTVFLTTAEEVKQKILPPGELDFHVAYQDLSSAQDKEKQIRALALAQEDISFDLGNGPLVRAQLLRIAEKEYLLLCIMHHIISDFLSMEVLQKEFLQLYEAFKKDQANPLKPLKFQYKEFACWQNKQLKGRYLETLRAYWGTQFNDQIPILQLPYDKKRSRLQSYNGETTVFSISENTTAKLRTIANENDATLFMVLLASVNIFLSFFSGQNDIIIGTPASGREHPDLENQIGFYLNTLALRTKFKEEEPFNQLLALVKKVALGAYEHQMYPFDKLIDDFKIKREPGRHPLFDVMVDMINLPQTSNQEKSHAPTDSVENDEVLEFLEIAKPRAKFDLVIYFYEELKNINVAFEYNTDLFERQTITRMVKRYRRLLGDIIKNPLTSISKLLLAEQVQLPTFGSFINK